MITVRIQLTISGIFICSCLDECLENNLWYHLFPRVDDSLLSLVTLVTVGSTVSPGDGVVLGSASSPYLRRHTNHNKTTNTLICPGAGTLLLVLLSTLTALCDVLQENNR